MIKRMAVVFTKKEYEHYQLQAKKAHFPTPELEYAWAFLQQKVCSKCGEEKKLTEFKGNTSGADAFASDGYRLRRPECNDCTKIVAQGKNIARAIAKKEGISYKAPEDATCRICNKPAVRGNGLVFDHCHEQNKFRGYCCNSCNRSMGVLGDNVDGLLKVLNYLLETEKATITQGEDGKLYRSPVNSTVAWEPVVEGQFDNIESEL